MNRLFPTRAGIAVPGPLRNFCVYEWSSPTNAAPLVGALPDQSSLRLQRDCQVVSPLSVPVADAVDALQATYDEQINAPVFLKGTPIPPAVRVAVIDSTPEETGSGLPSGALNSHGRAMGALIRHNSCLHDGLGSELGCTAFVTSYQGLPLAPSGGEGNFGRQSDVASAIVRSVQDFKAQAVQSHLILNLSLGWDSGYGALEGANIRMGAFSAWMAVQWAACEGALVLAAAGNRGSPNTPTGPMFPAGWEMDQRLCDNVPGAYGPPVQAVGAVNGADLPLEVARQDAQPRMVAPAIHVAVWYQMSNGVKSPSALLSGTSLAAAGASGLAALVWAINPTLAATDVADLLKLSGASNGGADFGQPGQVTDSRRLDACAAATMAAGNGPQAPLVCGQHPPFVPVIADNALVRDAQWPGLYAAGNTPGAGSALAGPPPPTKDSYIFPYATGQPGKPTCPHCTHQANFITGQIDTAGLPVDGVTYFPTGCGGGCPANGITLNAADFSKPFNIAIGTNSAGVVNGTLRIRSLTIYGSQSTYSEVGIIQ